MIEAFKKAVETRLQLKNPSPFSRVGWFELEIGGCRLAVYLRRGHRFFDKVRTSTLEIASASAYPQGTGAFSTVLGVLERLADEYGLVVYLENVIAPGDRLGAFYVRRGYVLIEGSEPPSFYRAAPSVG